jgi:flagellar hook-length control protein FliK
VSSTIDTASQTAPTTSLTADAIRSIATTKADVEADASAATRNDPPASKGEASSNAPVRDDRTTVAPEVITPEVAATVREVASDHDVARDPSPRNSGAPPTAKATTAARQDREGRGTEHVTSPRDADRPAGAAPASPVTQAAVAAQSQAPEARSSGSTAARFARALERASAPIASEAPSADPTSADAATTGQNGSPYEGQGRGQSAFVDRGTILTAAARVDSSPHGAIFTIPAAAAIELRGGAVVEGSSAAGETTLLQVPEREVVAQLVQSMRMQFRDGVGEAVVHLKPEHLGTVSISLRIENGAVSASIHAGVPEVRQWLESQQTQLRDGLADQGLRLERFIVEPDGKRQPADDQSDRSQARRRRPQSRRTADGAEQPIFEILA